MLFLPRIALIRNQITKEKPPPKSEVTNTEKSNHKMTKTIIDLKIVNLWYII